jgi:hypothetical protein
MDPNWMTLGNRCAISLTSQFSNVEREDMPICQQPLGKSGVDTWSGSQHMPRLKLLRIGYLTARGEVSRDGQYRKRYETG